MLPAAACAGTAVAFRLGIFANRYRYDGLLCVIRMGRGDIVTTQSGSHSRTITGYLVHLLQYPRWLIECDIDFTNCIHHGHYDDSVGECDICIFGKGCKWLNRYTTTEIGEAPLSELVDALECAVDYVAGRPEEQHPHDCVCDNCEWLRRSRAFLRSLN